MPLWILARQVRRARLRGWHLADNQLLQDLSYAIPSIQHELSTIAECVPRRAAVDRRATMHDIYHDLVALREEFEQLNYDRKGSWLSIVTEPIVLSGVYLGPFEIRLKWGQPTRGEMPVYRVIAQDPHPAESRENVTHPHVMDEILCEGDGRHAVRQALKQGRLLDFFLLVAGILRTYNPESPFVELALWHGGSCSDCGAGVDEDHSYACAKCGDTVCSECERLCCGCDDGYCSGCIGSCAACEDNYCRRCLERRHDCNGSFCSRKAGACLKGVLTVMKKNFAGATGVGTLRWCWRGVWRCFGSVRRPGPNCYFWRTCGDTEIGGFRDLGGGRFTVREGRRARATDLHLGIRGVRR